MKSVKFFMNSKGVIVEGDINKSGTKSKGDAAKGIVYFFRIKDGDLKIVEYVKGELDGIVYDGPLVKCGAEYAINHFGDHFMTGSDEHEKAMEEAVKLALKAACSALAGDKVKLPKVGKCLLKSKTRLASTLSVDPHTNRLPDSFFGKLEKADEIESMTVAEQLAEEAEIPTLLTECSSKTEGEGPTTPDDSFLRREERATLVVRLRKATHLSLVDCAKLLERFGYDYDKALDEHLGLTGKSQLVRELNNGSNASRKTHDLVKRAYTTVGDVATTLNSISSLLQHYASVAGGSESNEKIDSALKEVLEMNRRIHRKLAFSLNSALAEMVDDVKNVQALVQNLDKLNK